VNLTTQLHLALWLRTSGAMHLLPTVRPRVLDRDLVPLFVTCIIISTLEMLLRFSLSSAPEDYFRDNKRTINWHLTVILFLS
jgi:hypothetical protein